MVRYHCNSCVTQVRYVCNDFYSVSTSIEHMYENGNRISGGISILSYIFSAIFQILAKSSKNSGIENTTPISVTYMATNSKLFLLSMNIEENKIRS